MIVLFGVVAAILGAAVVIDEWRTSRTARPGRLFDGLLDELEHDVELALLAALPDELDDPARQLLGPWSDEAYTRTFAEIASL